ncbi:MAG: M20/M25/M40 family metallo-hydrolase [Acidobacteriia bacterium]|nr:M20/M25/M40 family metallo-hydrolase [Terriglobia bacterium]
MKKALLGTFSLLISCAVATRGQTSADEHTQRIAWEPYQDRAVRLLQEYLRIDTSNPPGNELKAAEFFLRLFDEAGVPNTVYPYAPGRADIYAVLKGDGSQRPLVLLNHMDVVQATPSSWRVPPFSGEILDGEIYGRGSLDMKDEGLMQAMVMMIAAQQHLSLNRDLIFLATSDEEVGDTGSAWILEHHPELVRDAEYLITEGGSNLILPGQGTVYGIGVAEKVPFWIRLTAHGRGGHGSIPIADSATVRLVRALGRVVDWNQPVRLLPTVEEYFHAVARLQPEPRASQYRTIRSALDNPDFVKSLMDDENFAYLLHDTVSLTVLQGGPQTNVIPDAASAELDVRLLPGSDPEEFLRALRKVVADDQIAVEPLGRYRRPNASSTDTALYRAIEQVVHRYNALALVTPTLNSGYTECQMYRTLGLTCYGFAPIELTPQLEATEHAPNERVPVEQVRRGVRVLYEVVAELTSR